MGTRADHSKGKGANEGAKGKKEGEKHKEEDSKSSWWNTNGVLARYHLLRKLHFYLGINECKTCLRPGNNRTGEEEIEIYDFANDSCRKRDTHQRCLFIQPPLLSSLLVFSSSRR